MLEQYVYKDNKKLRCGYTTGSCAAAAAKAATMMLLGMNKVTDVQIMTPKGIELKLKIEDINFEESCVRCAVRKDGGDDIDATDKTLIYAVAECIPDSTVIIDGGIGVGRVTKSGLDQSVGNAAINSIPRKMIKDAVLDVCKKLDYHKGIKIVIEVPEGEKIAKKTFNPRLGIEGGISILGTSGIVEPMSEQALIDTIKVEINMKSKSNCENLLLTPGNYGLDYVKGNTELSYEKAVKSSNFIGEALDFSVQAGFKKILFIGHIGKIVKVGAGIMNTHSKNADARMEILAACAIEAGIDIEILKRILQCNTTDDAIELLINNPLFEKVMNCLINRIQYYMTQRVHEEIEIGVITFSNRYGLLGKTKNADSMLELEFA